MTPNRIKEIWKSSALEAGIRGDHSYLPKNEEEAQNFEPHEWVSTAFNQLADAAQRMETAIRRAALQDGAPQDLIEKLVESLPYSPEPKPMAVVRDCDGCWTHPDLPVFDETSTISEINAYLEPFGLTSRAVWMEFDCNYDEFERYFEAGDSNITFWNPTCDIKGSFVLSIHDTEQGPVALFAYPQEAKDA